MEDAAHGPTTTRMVSWKDFGPFLQRLRRRRGLSQERLAEALGCHRTYIWRLEHGQNHPSRIFLHNLRVSFALAAEEAARLASFGQLREFGSDELPGAR